MSTKSSPAPTTEELRSSALVGTPDEWYKPGPSIKEFHRSPAKVRILIGGRGSGKTTGVAVEAVEHCVNNAGAKVLCVRQTQVANDDTSVKTFDEVYTNMGFAVNTDPEISLFRKWNDGLTARIPSRDAVEAYNKFLGAMQRTRAQIKTWIENEGDRLCSYIMFRGLKDDQKAQGQLRGFECSMFIGIEADLLNESDIDLAIGCLRWKNAYGQYFEHYTLILDTNPPSPRHWIALLEKKKTVTKPDPEYAFWHISTYENAHNMRPGYVEDLERQYADKPAHRRRYILGEYADLFDGSPVIHKFKEDKHAREEIGWPSGAYLVRGWDFGSTHANTFSAYFKVDFDVGGKIVPVEYWWDLHEYYQEMSDVDRQCAAVLEITDREFPFWNDRSVCAGVLDYCDPAGAQKKDTGCSVTVLNNNGIYPRWQTRVRSLDTTIAIVNRLMEVKDPQGRYTYKIDKKCCPRLYAAMLGEYRYPFAGEPGYSSGEPIKGPKANGSDHICFAAGTLVQTEYGERPIEQIEAGERVLTRQGLKRVNRAWLSGKSSPVRRYSFSNGRELVATLEHPVMSEAGWIPIDTLRYSGIEVYSWSKLNITAGLTEDTRSRNAGATESISNTTPNGCTGESMKTTLGQSLRGLSSTTGTEIPRITTLPILRRLLKKFTLVRDTLIAEVFLKLQGTQPQNGIGQTKAEHGIAVMLKVGRSLLLNGCANAVETSSQGQARLSTANRIVNPNTGQTLVSITLKSNVPCVGVSDFITGTNYMETGRATLVQSSAVMNADVYALSVEEIHEFFAEGILVSNCDAARYPKINLLQLAQKMMDEALKPNTGPLGNTAKKLNRTRTW